MRSLILSVVLTALFSGNVLAAVHRYIIPVWARDLQGARQVWTSEIQVSNAGSDVAMVRVADVYPAIEYTFCHPIIFCGPAEPRKFHPGDVLPVSPDFFKEAIAYRLAAVLIETDTPLKIETWVRGMSAGRIVNQELEVARAWIPAGVNSFVPERYYYIGGVAPDRTNLFVVNPNNQPLELRYRVTYRGAHRPPDTDHVMTVAPKSLAVGPPIEAYNDDEGGDFPVFPRITFSSRLPFYAVASDTDVNGDVIFRSPAIGD